MADKSKKEPSAHGKRRWTLLPRAYLPLTATAGAALETPALHAICWSATG